MRLERGIDGVESVILPEGSRSHRLLKPWLLCLYELCCLIVSMLNELSVKEDSYTSN